MQERQKRDREQFYAVSSKVSGRTQPVQPENPDRGSSRQRRQRQERRESSRSKIEQQRRSHHEQEPEGNTAEIIENLEPCKSDFHDKSDYSKSYYIFDSKSICKGFSNQSHWVKL